MIGRLLSFPVHPKNDRFYLLRQCDLRMMERAECGSNRSGEKDAVGRNVNAFCFFLEFRHCRRWAVVYDYVTSDTEVRPRNITLQAIPIRSAWNALDRFLEAGLKWKPHGIPVN